ncbi:MAG: hypothetical protein IJR46_02500 [Neisseriaceae bacterium]|nr:hypothetical protein [Neisseriaceae bacterium]
MPLIFFNKYKHLILFLTALLLSIAIYHTGYKNGANAEKAKAEQENAKAQQKAQKQAFNASEKYQNTKTQLEQERKQHNAQIEKIIYRDVYHNNCLDADGLQQLNNAITQ